MEPLGYPVRMPPSPWECRSGKTFFHRSTQLVSEERVCGMTAETLLEARPVHPSSLLGGSVYREVDSDLGPR